MNTNNILDLTPHFALDGDQPFKDRRAMMPFRGAIPVAKEQLAQTWQEMINQTISPRKRLVYCTFLLRDALRFAVFIKTVLMKMRALIIPTP